MRRNPGFVIPILALVLSAGVVCAGGLDGKTFEVSIAEAGGEAGPDTLIFKDGMFDSVECRQYGFGPAAYEAAKEGDGWGFSVSTSSEKEGVAHWKGTVSGDSISGTMEWVKPGQDAITYEFSGKLKS